MQYKKKIFCLECSCREYLKNNRPTHCVLCGCTPKPDEWSAQVDNACFDCA